MLFKCLIESHWLILPYQQTPLHVAASQGHCNVVEYLVMQGADVSIKDNDGVSVTILLMIDYIVLGIVSFWL